MNENGQVVNLSRPVGTEMIVPGTGSRTTPDPPPFSVATAVSHGTKWPDIIRATSSRPYHPEILSRSEKNFGSKPSQVSPGLAQMLKGTTPPTLIDPFSGSYKWLMVAESLWFVQ